MTKLEAAQITSVIPRIVAKQPWAQALSYAVNNLIRQALRYSAGTVLYSNLIALSDEQLDMIAAELRTPNYDQTFTKPIKRQLIRDTLQFWQQLGTNAAISDILTTIFGDARIEDWYEYDGEPGYFRIITTNPAITGETLARFEAAADRIKRLSAWLDEVIIDATIPTETTYIGAALLDFADETLREGELL